MLLQPEVLHFVLLLLAVGVNIPVWSQNFRLLKQGRVAPAERRMRAAFISGLLFAGSAVFAAISEIPPWLRFLLVVVLLASVVMQIMTFRQAYEHKRWEDSFQIPVDDWPEDRFKKGRHMSSMERLEDPLGDWSESATYYPRQLRLDRMALSMLGCAFAAASIMTLIVGAPPHVNFISAWAAFAIAGHRARSWKRRPAPDIFPERRRRWAIAAGLLLPLSVSWSLMALL